MADFVFKRAFRKRSNKDLNCIKRPSSVSYFKTETNGRYFHCDDVFLLKKKRNEVLQEFFAVYSNINEYDLIEFGVPYVVTNNISRIIQKVKRRCEAMNNQMLGFIWVFDVGEENFGPHYHFVIAIKKIKKQQYPEKLKISYRKTKLHGSYVRDRIAFKRYLIGKDVFERGVRKRVYGKSRCFKL